MELANSRSGLPRKGMLKINNAATVTTITCRRPTRANGSSLPSISSIGRSGVTINCSMVPISFSRTMLMAVSMIVTRAMMLTITPGTK